MLDEINSSFAPPQNEPAAGYEIGYGKPPQNGKWKPGESGNPLGKKKGAKSFKKLFLETALTKIAVKNSTGGTTKKPLIKLVVDAAFKHAINGKTKVALPIFKLLQKFYAADDVPEPKEGEVFKHGSKVYCWEWWSNEDIEAIESLRFLDPRRRSIEIIHLEDDHTCTASTTSEDNQGQSVTDADCGGPTEPADG
jgi:hypothetical protein